MRLWIVWITLLLENITATGKGFINLYVLSEMLFFLH